MRLAVWFLMRCASSRISRSGCQSASCLARAGLAARSVSEVMVNPAAGSEVSPVFEYMGFISISVFLNAGVFWMLEFAISFVQFVISAGGQIMMVRFAWISGA